MVNIEEEIKKIAEQYIKVLNTGNTKYLESNVDIRAMYEKDGEISGQFGLSKRMTLKEYESSFKNMTLYYMRKGWDKKFTFEAYELKGDEVSIKINAEGAKRQDQPLIIKKINGKWKIIWIPTWNF